MPQLRDLYPARALDAGIHFQCHCVGVGALPQGGDILITLEYEGGSVEVEVPADLARRLSQAIDEAGRSAA